MEQSQSVRVNNPAKPCVATYVDASGLLSHRLKQPDPAR